MREIKFRCWDKEEKQMSAPFKIADKNINYRDQDGVFMAQTYDLDCIEFNLMQYTGLLDKNGKEIYEGDIVKDQNKSRAEMVWNDRRGAWDNKFHEFPGFETLHEWEIIGNIHENPNLLGGEGK